MATEYSPNDNQIQVRRALEVTIHVGLTLLLAAACLLILLPFLPLVVWGIVIAIAVFPAYRKLRNLLGGRQRHCRQHNGGRIDLGFVGDGQLGRGQPDRD